MPKKSCRRLCKRFATRKVFKTPSDCIVDSKQIFKRILFRHPTIIINYDETLLVRLYNLHIYTRNNIFPIALLNRN